MSTFELPLTVIITVGGRRYKVDLGPWIQAGGGDLPDVPDDLTNEEKLAAVRAEFGADNVTEEVDI